jgi:hypothetical protein
MDCLYGFLGEMVSLCFGRGDGKLQWRCKGKAGPPPTAKDDN